MSFEIKCCNLRIYYNTHKVGELIGEYNPWLNAQNESFEIKSEDCVHLIKYGYCSKAIKHLNEKLGGLK